MAKPANSTLHPSHASNLFCPYRSYINTRLIEMKPCLSFHSNPWSSSPLRFPKPHNTTISRNFARNSDASTRRDCQLRTLRRVTSFYFLSGASSITAKHSVSIANNRVRPALPMIFRVAGHFFPLPESTDSILIISYYLSHTFRSNNFLSGWWLGLKWAPN